MTDLQKSFYDEIVLSEEEKEEALLNARIKKYFHERNKEYWEALERVVPNKADETPVQASPNMVEKRSPKSWNKAYKIQKAGR